VGRDRGGILDDSLGHVISVPLAAFDRMGRSKAVPIFVVKQPAKETGCAGIGAVAAGMNVFNHPEIRRLIEVWEAADRNIGKLFKQNPDIQRYCTYGKTILIPARNGAAQLAWLPDLLGKNLLPHQTDALNLFVWLLLNPLAKYLGGPCKRCGAYFARSDPRQKTYCKRQCGAATTASARTKERRENEYQDKIARAELAIKKWEQKRRKGDWKKWVRNETGFDLRFITQAVTRKKLISPLGERTGLKG
jgi:hypothetical protein